MTRRPRTPIAGLLFAFALLAGSFGPPAQADPAATPKATCGPRPAGTHGEEGLQGRRTAAELGDMITCNTEKVGSFGDTSAPGGAGGFRVYRYTDANGHECGFYDSTLLFPTNAGQSTGQGVIVLDMSNPAAPSKTANLTTPAMLSPHESLVLSESRGLLAAGMGTAFTYPGWVDIYDVSQNCLQPTLKSSTPFGILGHEGTFSPDGKTLWISSTGGHTITAIDVLDPEHPSILWTNTDYVMHGLTISDDGTRLYGADLGQYFNSVGAGLTILNVADIQNRVPNPVVSQVSHFEWPTLASIPQVPIPVTITTGNVEHKYIVEIDEFARNLQPGVAGEKVGAARIINIDDEAHPSLTSNIRLEVNNSENVATTKNDPGATFSLQGYTGHYCAVPKRKDPGIVACSFILSGLRVFDIRDPAAPKEVAYFNPPVPSSQFSVNGQGGSYAMSAPAFDPGRGNIWYTDGSSGFWAVHVTNGAWPL